jgi:hypothetical protein
VNHAVLKSMKKKDTTYKEIFEKEAMEFGWRKGKGTAKTFEQTCFVESIYD